MNSQYVVVIAGNGDFFVTFCKILVAVLCNLSRGLCWCWQLKNVNKKGRSEEAMGPELCCSSMLLSTLLLLAATAA